MQLAPVFVVVDSTGEALALEGAKPNNDDEVANWFRTWPRRIANHTGAAVTVIDHVVKDETTRGLWPGGSQRKKAAINGAAFMLTPITELGRGADGRMKITTSKDRSGVHRTCKKAAEFVLNADGTWALEGAAESERTGPPTFLMERISRWLQLQGKPQSQRVILAEVDGRDRYKKEALSELVSRGHIRRFEHGQSLMHEHVSLFTEAADLLGGEVIDERQEQW
jgi:hypothetical protein